MSRFQRKIGFRLACENDCAASNDLKRQRTDVAPLRIRGLPCDHVIRTASNTKPDMTHEVPPEIQGILKRCPFAPAPRVHAFPAISQALKAYKKLWFCSKVLNRSHTGDEKEESGNDRVVRRI